MNIVAVHKQQLNGSLFCLFSLNCRQIWQLPLHFLLHIPFLKPDFCPVFLCVLLCTASVLASFMLTKDAWKLEMNCSSWLLNWLAQCGHLGFVLVFFLPWPLPVVNLYLMNRQEACFANCLLWNPRNTPEWKASVVDRLKIALRGLSPHVSEEVFNSHAVTSILGVLVRRWLRLWLSWCYFCLL